MNYLVYAHNTLFPKTAIIRQPHEVGTSISDGSGPKLGEVKSWASRVVLGLRFEPVAPWGLVPMLFPWSVTPLASCQDRDFRTREVWRWALDGAHLLLISKHCFFFSLKKEPFNIAVSAFIFIQWSLRARITQELARNAESQALYRPAEYVCIWKGTQAIWMHRKVWESLTWNVAPGAQWTQGSGTY